MSAVHQSIFEVHTYEIVSVQLLGLSLILDYVILSIFVMILDLEKVCFTAKLYIIQKILFHWFCLKLMDKMDKKDLQRYCSHSSSLFSYLDSYQGSPLLDKDMPKDMPFRQQYIFFFDDMYIIYIRDNKTLTTFLALVHSYFSGWSGLRRD